MRREGGKAGRRRGWERRSKGLRGKDLTDGGGAAGVGGAVGEEGGADGGGASGRGEARVGGGQGEEEKQAHLHNISTQSNAMQCFKCLNCLYCLKCLKCLNQKLLKSV